MNFRLLYKTPPRLIVKKARRWLQNLFCKKLSQIKPTYSYNNLKGYLDVRLPATTCVNSLDSNQRVPDTVINHVFDLLGSGPVNVCYGLNAKGFEEYKYPAFNVDFDFDSEGFWLKRFINRTNIAYSQKIWQFLQSIDSSYQPIDWQVDFKSGFRWDNSTFYKDIRIGDKLGADVKVPWELSRFQHLSELSLAYQTTKDERYAKEYICQILDWIATNPPMFGVNWASTMDVAIRATNWLFWFGHIRDWLEKQEWKDEFYQIFLNSLYDHLKFIPENLEMTETLTTNHYLANIAGLLIIASSTENIFAESQDLKQFAVSELKEEMLKQFYSDGTNFEASTCYHRLGLEIVFFAVWWEVVRNHNFKGTNYREVAEAVFGLEFVKRLYKAFEVVLYLLKPNGQMPQIGDNDNGQFVKLWHRDLLDTRYLLALGGVFFNDSKFKIKEFFQNQDDIQEIRVLYGERGYELWDNMDCSELADIKSTAFADSGWYIMRDTKNYCIVSCGSNGQNERGGHCHNDKLSFELCIDGQDIVVDPGTYVYTADPEARNKFRGTAFHNTVVVDGQEQGGFDPKNLFALGSDARPRCLKWETGEEVHTFVGEHYGFGRLAQPVIHRREIRFHRKEKKLQIIDRFEGKGEHTLEWNIILSPEFKPELRIDSDKLQWREEHTFYSKGYGLTSSTIKLCSGSRMTLPAEVVLSMNIFNSR